VFSDLHTTSIRCFYLYHESYVGLFSEGLLLGILVRVTLVEFRERVLASLKLKMELCPMADYTAPRASEVGIV
jgi:hypothetical protein